METEQGAEKSRDLQDSVRPSGHASASAHFLAAKSPLRMKYEAEAVSIQKKIGGLEEIRSTLGLSQRKICQLLLVDPSAWTRWTRNGETAPPHIYRALQWYLAVEEKYPSLDLRFWLSNLTRSSDTQDWEKELTALSCFSESLSKSMQELQREREGERVAQEERIHRLETEWGRRLQTAEKRGENLARRLTYVTLACVILAGFILGRFILKF